MRPGPKRKFNGVLLAEPLSREAVYWLGFIFADGCIIKRPSCFVVSVNMGTTDSDHLLGLAEFCGVNSFPLLSRGIRLNLFERSNERTRLLPPSPTRSSSLDTRGKSSSTSGDTEGRRGSLRGRWPSTQICGPQSKEELCWRRSIDSSLSEFLTTMMRIRA
jgi:hypothetical protein